MLLAPVTHHVWLLRRVFETANADVSLEMLREFPYVLGTAEVAAHREVRLLLSTPACSTFAVDRQEVLPVDLPDGRLLVNHQCLHFHMPAVILSSLG